MTFSNLPTRPAGLLPSAVCGAVLALALSTGAHAADAMAPAATGPTVAGPVVERHIADDMRPGAFGDTQRTYPVVVEGNAWVKSSDIDATQSALDELRKQDGSQVPQGARAFELAKAQCWIDLARHTYREVALTGITETSIGVARRQIDALAGSRGGAVRAEFETPELRRGSDTAFADLPQVAGVREDLWRRLIGYRTAKALRCVPTLVPCMETDLVEGGYEVAANLRPVQHAGEAITRAEERAGKIDEGLAACTEPVAVVPPPPVPPPAPRRFTLSGATLFKFDGWKPAALLPGGRREIEKIASQLKGDYTRIDRLEITGHTDRLGSQAYNLRLSQHRAETVAQMLRSLGVAAGSVGVRGVGEAEPVTQDCRDRLPAKALRECLQPDRRVAIDVTGETR